MPPAAVGRVPCVQPILKSFLVCRWQARRFSHKQGEPAVETVKATTDSERRKSQCRYTYTDVRPRLRADAVRWNYVTCLPRPPPPCQPEHKTAGARREGAAKNRQRSFVLPWQQRTSHTQTLANGSLSQTGSTCPRGREGGKEVLPLALLKKREIKSRGEIFDIWERNKKKKKSSTNLTTFLVHCHAHTRFTLSSYKQVFTIAGWEETCSQLSSKKTITRIKKQQNAGDDGGDSTFRVGSFRSPSIECELCLCMHDVFKDLCTFEKN